MLFGTVSCSLLPSIGRHAAFCSGQVGWILVPMAGRRSSRHDCTFQRRLSSKLPPPHRSEHGGKPLSPLDAISLNSHCLGVVGCLGSEQRASRRSSAKNSLQLRPARQCPGMEKPHRTRRTSEARSARILRGYRRHITFGMQPVRHWAQLSKSRPG